MELRVYRTFDWVNQGYDGSCTEWALTSHDQLQFSFGIGHDWTDVPLVEAEKPMHPREIANERYRREIDDYLKDALKNGK